MIKIILVIYPQSYMFEQIPIGVRESFRTSILLLIVDVVSVLSWLN